MTGSSFFIHIDDFFIPMNRFLIIVKFSSC